MTLMQELHKHRAEFLTRSIEGTKNDRKLLKKVLKNCDKEYKKVLNQFKAHIKNMDYYQIRKDPTSQRLVKELSALTGLKAVFNSKELVK